jgi:hypothetical protein
MQLIAARFIGSMIMHINTEKEVQQGINLMKYSVNHYEEFTNPYAAFLLAFLHFLVSISVELNVMIIYTSIQDVVEVLMKYVALSITA